MPNLHLIFTILLLVLTQLGFSQRTALEHITQEDGLPSDLVKSLVVDSAGFVWVATDGGLAKIEGRNIRKVTDSEKTNGRYKDVFLSKKYGMVAACDGELLKIEQDYKGIYSYGLNDGLNVSNYPEFLFPKDIFEACDSSLWFADSKAVVHISGEKASTYELTKKNHTINYFRNSQIIELDCNHLFVLSQKGYMYKYNRAKDTLIEMPWNYEGTEIFTIHKLKPNQFLIGCEKGILQITFANGLIHEVSDLQFEYGVYVIEPLKENHYLVGTIAGAYEIILNEKTVESNIFPGSEGVAVLDIVHDNQEQIWLGTGYGIIIYKHLALEKLFKEASIGEIVNLKTNCKEQLFFTDGNSVYQSNKERVLSKYYTIEHGVIRSIFPENNSLWMGTSTGYLIEKRDKGNEISYDFSKEGYEIQSVAVDKNSAVWFIQIRKGETVLLRMDPNGEVKDFTPDSKEEINLRFLKLSLDGDIYIGAKGRNSYLFKYDYSKNSIDNLSLPIDSLTEIPLIHDIAFAKNGTCFLATENGIFEYNGFSVKRLDLGDISNDAVTAIAIDSIGRIWFGHSTGIICYNDGKLSLYENSDGLNTKTTSYRCLLFDSEDGFWIGSAGINYGKMPSVLKPSLSSKIVRIENLGTHIDVNGRSKFLQNSLLKIVFTSANYPAQYVKYQYSLNRKNERDNWKDIEYKQNHVSFDYLAEGDYTFKIRAKSSGYYGWSKPIIYRFHIYKIWYLHPEFMVGINLVFLLLVYLYLRYRQVKNTKEKKKLEGIIADRTKDLQNHNEELITAKERTEEAIQTKDRFFSILGHDLSSPFNTLIGYSRLLVDNPKALSEEKKSFVFAEMLKTSESTYKLLRNLLDWSLSQTGALIINKEQIEFNNLLTEVLPTLKATAKQKDIIINVEASEDISIFADKAMVATILRNLVSNAIKFSNTNSEITISARMEQSYCYISVTDQGIGIPEEIINKLFAIDKNTSTKGTNKEEGTGLGLVLCKEFATLNQGDVSVESKQNIGSTFTVNLPSEQL